MKTGFVNMLSILCLISLLSCNKEPQPRLPDGSEAPGFTLQTLDGSERTFTPGESRLTLIEFWAATCSPCREAFPLIDSLYQKLSDKGLAVYSVCQSSKIEDAEKFVADFPNHRLPVMFDPAPTEESIGFNQYLIDGFPSFFLVDESGKVVKSFKGFWEGRSIEGLYADIAKFGIE